MAFKEAVEEVIDEHARLGLPLYIWRDGKVVGLQEPGHRAGDRDGSSDAGHGQIARLLSGDDLRGLPRWRAPGQWQPGDPAQLDLPLLQVLARRAAADFPRKPA